MNDELVIMECRIDPPTGWGWGHMAKIYVKYEGTDEWKLLFCYFTDDLSFSADKFVGMTEEQANRYIHDCVDAYLRS